MEVELWEKLDGALAWRLLERYNDVTRQVGRERGVLTVDLARALPKDSTFFYDFFHFTNEGADRVGAILHDALAPWLAARYPDYACCRAPAEDRGAAVRARCPAAGLTARGRRGRDHQHAVVAVEVDAHEALGAHHLQKCCRRGGTLPGPPGRCTSARLTVRRSLAAAIPHHVPGDPEGEQADEDEQDRRVGDQRCAQPLEAAPFESFSMKQPHAEEPRAAG